MATISPQQFARALRAAGRERVNREIMRVMTSAAAEAEALGKLNATRLLRVRTGRLRNSIIGDALQQQEGWLLRLKAGNLQDVVYARTQEEGATIRPKNARYLAIPLDPGPAVTGAGVSRYNSPRQVPGLSVRRSSGGNLSLVDDTGRPWYVLRKSVRIRGKFYLKRALNEIEGRLPQQLAGALDIAIRDSTG